MVVSETINCDEVPEEVELVLVESVLVVLVLYVELLLPLLLLLDNEAFVVLVKAKLLNSGTPL